MEEVAYVVATDYPEVDIHAFIKTMDYDACLRLIEEESKIRVQFPDLEFDFHVVFLEGRPLSDFINPLPALVYSREKAVAQPG